MRRLESIYRLCDAVILSSKSWKCKAGCAHCCTSLASLTSLEAAYLYERYQHIVKDRLDSCGDLAPPLSLTTNERATLCLSRVDFEEESASVEGHPCPLLQDDRCSCYDARPLMCRLMLSSVDCGVRGYAQIPPELLSLDTACLQIMEDLDSTGWSGYLVHLLPYFLEDEFLDQYRAEMAVITDKRLRHNVPNPGLLIPPEHNSQIEKWLRQI
jgi:Fe-S-cluster containining protein